MATPGKLVAQASDLDPAPLIDALARQGMDELLGHLMATEPPDDPVLTRQVEVAQHRLEFLRLNQEADRAAAAGEHASARALRDSALQAFEKMLAATRELINDFYDHDQRPIWQTDLAQTLLLDYLQGIQHAAALFEEFGVTTPKQRAALAEAAPEALALLVDADTRLFHLRGEVGRDPKRSEQLEANGLFQRLFEDYDQRRTPYFLAQAAYLVARLPDDSPYFAGLGSSQDPRIQQQKQTPTQERARLLDLAYKELGTFTGDLSDLSGARSASLSLRARVLLAQGRSDQALEALDELVKAREGGLAGLTAGLAKAVVLQEMGRPQQALDTLSRLRQDPKWLGDLRYALLVTDMTHRVMLTQARQLPPTSRDAAVAASYQPYLDLLAGPITGDKAQGLRDYIYRRWELTLEDSDESSSLPPVVRLAVSQVMRQQGQDLAERVEQALADEESQQDDGVDVDDLRRQADHKLTQAIELAHTLIGPSVEPAIRSEAMFNLAMAMYWTAPKDAGNRLALTEILTDLAEQMPGQPIAEDAITVAVSLLREVHQVLPTPAEIESAYRRSAEVLFSKFPVSPAADNERLYYGYAVFHSAGMYRQAVDMYSHIPFDHDDYFRGQRQVLYCLGELSRSAEPSTAARVRRELASVLKRVGREAKQVRGSLVNPERDRTARRAVATGRLVTADLALGDRDYDKALEVLDGFERDYHDESDLIAAALEDRIVALGDAGRQEDLAQAARRMTRDYPDEAASVIDEVLRQTDRRIDRLRAQAATADTVARQSLLDQAKELASTAAMLSGLLLDWAKTQALDADQMMPFELIHAKTLRLSGQVQPAGDIMGRLILDYPNDAQVMLEYAQILFAKGEDASLIEAVGYFDRLITGLGPPYPQAWWVAWMRRLQINDRLNEGTGEIPLRVRQLRLTDPNLGGPVTKQELERLEHKYSR